MLLQIRSYIFIVPIALMSAVQLRADSVTLVTGEKITGTIKGETASEVTIDVPVSASITDERVIRKDDIAKIDKEQADEIAYKQLIQVQPNPQVSYRAETYDQILAALDTFEATYPSSSYLGEVKKLRDAFQDEKRHVDNGEFKYEGRWLSKDEAIRRRIQIYALQVYGTMQQQAAAANFVGAMQTFASIEQNYNTTRIYPAAVVLAQQVLVRLQQDMANRMEAIRADQVQLKNTIAFTAEPAKSALIAQTKAEDDRNAAIVAAAVQGGAKWVPLIPRSQVSVETLQRTALSESTRLNSVPVAAMNNSIAKVDAARDAIEGGNYTVADTLLKEATTLWPLNEAAQYWTGRLKEKMATPTPRPVAATPKPLPTVRPTPQTVSIITPAAPHPVIEDKPFYMTLSGAMPVVAGALIAVGLVGSYIQKKAKKEQQVAE